MLESGIALKKRADLCGHTKSALTLNLPRKDEDMAKDSSASTRRHTPHVNQSTSTPSEETRPQTPDYNDDNARDKIEALAEIICRGADESAAALLVLMSWFEESNDPRVLAHTVKHFAFTRCGELNLFGMVDAQIAAVERELCVG